LDYLFFDFSDIFGELDPQFLVSNATIGGLTVDAKCQTGQGADDQRGQGRRIAPVEDLKQVVIHDAPVKAGTGFWQTLMV
jgi:hypothetical protein